MPENKRKNGHINRLIGDWSTYGRVFMIKHSSIFGLKLGLFGFVLGLYWLCIGFVLGLFWVCFGFVWLCFFLIDQVSFFFIIHC
jgi:hypothetical protein